MTKPLKGSRDISGPGRAAIPQEQNGLRDELALCFTLGLQLASEPPREALSAAQAPAHPASLSHPAWNPRSGNRTAALGLAGHRQPRRDSVPHAPLRAICSLGWMPRCREAKLCPPLFSHLPCNSGPVDREKTEARAGGSMRSGLISSSHNPCVGV